MSIYEWEGADGRNWKAKLAGWRLTWWTADREGRRRVGDLEEIIGDEAPRAVVEEFLRLAGRVRELEARIAALEEEN